MSFWPVAYSLLMLSCLATFWLWGAFSLWVFLVPAVLLRAGHLLFAQYRLAKRVEGGVVS